MLLAMPLQDIHPNFTKEIGSLQNYEKPLELSELLNQNFLCYCGQGPLPTQIENYLSENWKEFCPDKNNEDGKPEEAIC